MANSGFDRDDRVDRPRGYDIPSEPFDRSGGTPVDRGFPPVRTPYTDRAPIGGDAYSTFGSREPASVADGQGGNNVTIYSPKSYADVQTMIDLLRRKQSVIVNLDGIESASAQRILDFMSGAAYAIGGSMRRVKDMHSTFLITPQGTGITDTDDRSR